MTSSALLHLNAYTVYIYYIIEQHRGALFYVDEGGDDEGGGYYCMLLLMVYVPLLGTLMPPWVLSWLILNCRMQGSLPSHAALLYGIAFLTWNRNTG